MAGCAAAGKDGKVDPGEIRRIADAPDDAVDIFGGEVDRGVGFRRLPDRDIPGFARRFNGAFGNVGVDTGFDTFVDAVGFVEIAL